MRYFYWIWRRYANAGDIAASLRNRVRRAKGDPSGARTAPRRFNYRLVPIPEPRRRVSGSSSLPKMNWMMRGSLREQSRLEIRNLRVQRQTRALHLSLPRLRSELRLRRHPRETLHLPDHVPGKRKQVPGFRAWLVRVRRRDLRMRREQRLGLRGRFPSSRLSGGSTGRRDGLLGQSGQLRLRKRVLFLRRRDLVVRVIRGRGFSGRCR
jgi:hypothetical protein